MSLREEWAPASMLCAQDTVGFYHPRVILPLAYRKHLPLASLRAGLTVLFALAIPTCNLQNSAVLFKAQFFAQIISVFRRCFVS